MMKAERDATMDVVRITAFFTVICVHFFLNSGFYAQTVAGRGMYVMVLLRTAFMVCVPLFIMLTGYLCHRKTLTTRYYHGVLRVVTGYFLCGLACSLFINCWVSGDGFSPLAIVKGLVHFKKPPYGWYVEMHIGLFLLIPFLNLSYHGLKSRQRKLALVVTLLVCTALPSVFNVFCFTPGWWAAPALVGGAHQLIPAWWMGIYPLTYYFIGAFLAEYRPRVKALPLFLLLCLNIVLAGSFNFWHSRGGVYSYGIWHDWGALQNVVSSVLVFLLLTCIDSSRWPDRLKRALQYLSGLTLSAYLLSYIFDSLFYPGLNNGVESVTHRLFWFPVIVPLVAVCSLALAAVVEAVNHHVALPLLERIGSRFLPSVFAKTPDRKENGGT